MYCECFYCSTKKMNICCKLCDLKDKCAGKCNNSPTQCGLRSNVLKKRYMCVGQKYSFSGK